MDYIIVQAGGRGSRLDYLTHNKPKALVPVENRPILFHLFEKFPDKNFIIITDYKREVMRRYLSCFARVSYKLVATEGTGNCAGISDALSLIPSGEAFMLIWSDLILSEAFQLPMEYQKGQTPQNDYVGLSGDFQCRWSFRDCLFQERPSTESGVAGMFLFTDKEKLKDVPSNGEFVEWLSKKNLEMKPISMQGTREIGLLKSWKHLPESKWRPFTQLIVEDSTLIKEPVSARGEQLAAKERAWYRKLLSYKLDYLPEIYNLEPLCMEFISGKSLYEGEFPAIQKEKILEKIIGGLTQIHKLEETASDAGSMEKAYFQKTMERLETVQQLIPFANLETIKVNGKRCMNVFFQKEQLKDKLSVLQCEKFQLIHGDCTFSNTMIRDDGRVVFLDPRGYFGNTELYGDVRYDWAKLYYSIVGNYDQFNLKRFRLEIGGKNGTDGTSLPEGEVSLKVASNGWENMEDVFFNLTGAKREEIRLLHAIIWLSLTTYVWPDYDSVCGAFYNGIYYLEDVL